MLMDSGGLGMAGRTLRRNGSLAALRDMPGSRSMLDTTSAASQTPAYRAVMASTMENSTTGVGREKWVISSRPSDDASNCGDGAPPSPRATTASMSPACRPASRMAFVDASRARLSDDRPLDRLKPVVPTPAMAIWSLIGYLITVF